MATKKRKRKVRRASAPKKRRTTIRRTRARKAAPRRTVRARTVKRAGAGRRKAARSGTRARARRRVYVVRDDATGADVATFAQRPLAVRYARALANARRHRVSIRAR